MKLLILDGNSVINRAFFGVKPLTNREGLYTHAIYGFLNILEKMEKEEQPEAIAVAFDNLKNRFQKALDGDLNTSVAVTALYDVLKAKCNDATKLAALKDFDQVLSLNLLEAAEALNKKQAEEAAANADPVVDALVEARTAAKKAKNFAEADRIRDELKAMGVEIIDTPQGTKWRKV